MSNVVLSDDLFCLILDYFTDPNIIGLRQLVIENCSFHNMDKISAKIKDYIEDSKLMRIQLNNVHLSSRNFCIVSLGIGSRPSFQYFGVKDNEIAFIAKKCLDVLLKFHKETQFNLSGNPIEKDIKGKSGYSRCFA